MRQTGSSRLKVVSCTTSLSMLLTGMDHEVRCQVERVIENSTNFCANFRYLNWMAHGTQNRWDFTSAVPRLLPAHQPRLLGLLPLSGRGLILINRGHEVMQLLHTWEPTSLYLAEDWASVPDICPQRGHEIMQLLHSWLCTASTWQRNDPLFPTSVLREDQRTAVTLVTLHSLYLAEEWSSVPYICPQRRSENSCYTRDSAQPLPGRGLILCSLNLSSEKIREQLLHSWLCTVSTWGSENSCFLVTLHSLYLRIWKQLYCYTRDSAQPLPSRG